MQRFQAWAAIGLTTCVLTFAGCPGETPEDGGPSEPDVVEPEDDAGPNEPEDDAGPNEPDPVEPEDDAGPGEPEDAGPGEPEDAGPGEPEDAGPGEPEDGGPIVDGGEPEDGGPIVDGGEPEDGGPIVDGGDPVDGGPGDVVVPNPAASAAISAVLVDGTLDTVIDGAFVTDIRPAIGGDEAGFFLQAEQNGPALFVAMDPATVTIPAIEVGMDVSLIVRAFDDGPLGRIVTNVDSIVVNDTDLDVSPLVQDVTDVADLVSNFAAYENELVTASVTLTSAPGFAGSGFVGMDADTAAVVGEDLVVRMPAALPGELNLVPGCSFTTNPRGLWNFGTTAQLSIYEREDLSAWVCPFAIQAAQAADATTVVVSFDRDIDSASVAQNGSDFSISPALDVTAASVNGRVVTLTTASQTAGESYTLTVGDGIRDDLGSSLENSVVAFEGYTQLDGLAAVIVNEIDYDTQLNDDEGEFIELMNTGPTTVDFAVTPFDLVLVNGSASQLREYQRVTFDSGTLAAGELLLFSAPSTNYIQNGAPDGVVLVDATGSVLSGVVYEGTLSTVSIGGFDVDLSTFPTVEQNAPEDPGNTEGSICRSGSPSSLMTFCAGPPTPGAANP